MAPIVTEERRFAWRADQPIAPQVMRLIADVGAFLHHPEAQGARIREIVVVVERPVPQLQRGSDGEG